jgi:predicted MarR family transcription regulator
MQLYYLGFISVSLHVSGIRRAHHQEYNTAMAVIGIAYERWFVKCVVASEFKFVQNG